MQTIKCDMIECRRFLAAWRRFQSEMTHHVDPFILAHYHHLAVHYQALLQASTELQPLESDLSSVVRTVHELTQEEKRLASPQRILRASELVQLHETRIHENSETSGQVERDKASGAANEMMPDLCSQFTNKYFESMLEDTAPQEDQDHLSVKAIRKRLGLVDRVEAQATAFEKVAQEEQERLQAEMMALATQLKERTQTINHALVEDVKMLDAVGQHAESNTVLLDRERAKLKEQVASSIGLWTSLWLVAMLVLVFVFTYFYMKLFSRRW
ncbi:hypothetical protein PsorP6_016898 [Peronosclerospora sorghi]|uniref:Uncharacterized protein n=1 Tax=Peronosclerospora sorghi TaxID=230839 RepID=A0ACC0WC86_9STRA|nr:hypothetical protein PsorP6_016898 [Peronosclerospora sorghi]